MDKVPHLGGEVMLGLLQSWPIQSSTKEVLYLNELDEILELTTQEEIGKVTSISISFFLCLYLNFQLIIDIHKE